MSSKQLFSLFVRDVIFHSHTQLIFVSDTWYEFIQNFILSTVDVIENESRCDTVSVKRAIEGLVIQILDRISLQYAPNSNKRTNASHDINVCPIVLYQWKLTSDK
jgi:hypothetical protein